MRTKALVLTAALTAAGVATSMAQVYSVNAVGYVNKTIGPGFTMIANPFVNQTNTLNALLPPTVLNVPGLTFYKFNGNGYVTSVIDEFSDPLAWFTGNTPVGDTETLVFGDGAFLFNPTQTPFTWTTVGEVAQGTPISNPVPAGFSIKSSKVPQEGRVTTDLGYVVTGGERILKFDSAANPQAYVTYTFDEFALEWFRGATQEEPRLGIGESAFFERLTPTVWNRNFTVN